MTTDAFTQPLPGAARSAGRAVARVPAAHGVLMLVAMCLCAGAGLVAGSRDGRDAAAATGRAVVANRADAAIASGPPAVEAARRALAALGMRDIAQCDASCAMQTPVAARRLAADRVQAVIVSGSSPAAAALVHGLRQAGSHAMVVLIAPAEPGDVVRRLPGDERTWLTAAVGNGNTPASIRLAIVGRDGDVLD